MKSVIASVKDVPPGKMINAVHRGKNILVANVGGRYYAVGNNCTHLGCLLSLGTLIGEKVQCPCKGSIFDLWTGAVLQGPAEVPEPVYKLKVEGDQIFLIE